MSSSAVRFTFDNQAVKYGERSVYQAIAFSVRDETGQAWPSVREIARRTGLSRRHVYRCLKALTSRGLIEYVRHGRGRGLFSVYRLIGFLVKRAAAPVKVTCQQVARWARDRKGDPRFANSGRAYKERGVPERLTSRETRSERQTSAECLRQLFRYVRGHP